MENINNPPYDEKTTSPLLNGQLHVFSPQPFNKDAGLLSRKTKNSKMLQNTHHIESRGSETRHGVDTGYLISPTRTFLLERCNTSDYPVHALREIKYLYLANLRIRTLGHIQSCRHLVVCILHNNYLTRFDALHNCLHLKRIDLHCNQVARLPGEDFWKDLKQLQILNLHDNNIGKIESIQALSHSSSLVALTLYNTPLSLKNNYRHHTVNSIWSLKALDHHVVGDDEIIEDAIFSKRFCAMNPSLFIDLCPRETEYIQPRTLEVEQEVIRKILFNINLRLAHGSPVIVIQRWIRGHLCRRKLNISYFEVRKKLVKLNLIGRGMRTPSGSRTGVGFALDYDTYLKNRRPGSKTPSASTSMRANTPVKSSYIESRFDEVDLKIPPQLQIDIGKLEENALRSFDNSPEHNITIHVHKDPSLPTKSLFSKALKLSFEKGVAVTEKSKLPIVATGSPAVTTHKPKRQHIAYPIDGRVHEIPTQLPTTSSGRKEAGERKEMATQYENDPEIPNHEWRIHNKSIEVAGNKPAVVELDPLQEYVLVNREVGRDIRDAIEFWHEKEYSKPKPVARKDKPASKLRDNLSLATLMAVTKAYRDRDKTDNIALKVDRVMKVQQERMQAKQIVSSYLDERRCQAITQRQQDRLRAAEAARKAEATKATYLEYAQERKEKSMQRHHQRHKDIVFAADFGNQQVSVSNALIRHDRQSAKEDFKHEKTEIVNGIKVQLSEQAELVRRYMEHKQLVRQMTGTQEKSRLESKVLQDANDRLMESRQRVAGMKARRAAVQTYQHSLPPTAQPGAWPLAMESQQQPVMAESSRQPEPAKTPEQKSSLQPSDIVAGMTSSLATPLVPFPSTDEDFVALSKMHPAVALQT